MKYNFIRYPLPLLSLSLSLLCACVDKTPKVSEVDLVSKTLPAVNIPSEWSALVNKGDVRDGWLNSFKDPTLESLVTEALKQNLSLQAVQAKLEGAAGAARLAGASLSPVVKAGISADAKGDLSGSSFESRGAGLTMSWELDVWGRLKASQDAATANYEGALQDLIFARQSLVAAVAKAWFLATESSQQLSLARSNTKSAQETLRILQVRQSAGKVNAQDLALARSQLASSQEREEASKSAHLNALRSLEVLLGRYPSADLKASLELPALPPPVPAGLPSEILERRPDVMAAERRVAAAFKKVESAKLAQLPRLSLTGGLGVSSDGLKTLLSGGGGFFNVGANLLAPIVDGGALKAQVEIATSEQKAALAAYGQVALKSFSDVEGVLANEKILADREKLLAIAASESDEALRLRRLQVKAGKADLLSVLELESRVNVSKSALVFVRSARRAERVNLHLALGGNFE
jgi:NodT family efflux transporter outer membrane factor (OMF) lipoprotein